VYNFEKDDKFARGAYELGLRYGISLAFTFIQFMKYGDEEFREEAHRCYLRTRDRLLNVGKSAARTEWVLREEGSSFVALSTIPPEFPKDKFPELNHEAFEDYIKDEWR